MMASPSGDPQTRRLPWRQGSSRPRSAATARCPIRLRWRLSAIAEPAVARAQGEAGVRGEQLSHQHAQLREGAVTTSSNQRQQQQQRHSSWPVTRHVLDDVVTMFNTMPHEHDYWVESAWVTGRIPPELRGTYLRNGPALQVATGKHQRHFMDGDGCVLSLAFPGGGAMPRFTNRYVRTEGFVDEQASGKPVHRNAFTRGAVDGSPWFNPLDLSFKNVSNTNVLYWGGRMWSLWEVGLPYELNPRTLETLGESDMDGQIRQRLAGHYRVITEADGSQRLVVFGAQVSFTGMHLEFYELDTQGKVIASSKQPLKGFDINFIHDMLVTEHWYIVVMGPVEFDLKGFLSDYLMGRKALAELLIYNKDKQSKVFLYPRPGKTPPAAAGPLRRHELLAPPFFSFHHVNAYERAGGAEVVVDTISWQDIAFDVTQYNIKEDYYDGGCRSQLYRLVAHLPTSRVTSCRRMVRRTLEFPTYATTRVTGRPYRFAYFSADAVDDETAWAPAQAVLKVQLPVDDPPASTSAWDEGEQEAQGPGGDGNLHEAMVPCGGHRDGSATSSGDGSGKLPDSSSSRLTRSQSRRRRGSHAAPADASRDVGVDGDDDGLDISRVEGAMNHIVPWGIPVASSSQQAQQAQQQPWRREEGGGVVCEEWRPGPRCFPQEPMFVPRPGGQREDDGWIIVGVHNAETVRGEVAILDAQRLSEGPVAVIHLPHALPTGLHGTWTDEYLGPDPRDPSVPAWREPNTIRTL